MIDNFDELISKGIHLVDFYADWCGPCKVMAENLKNIEDKIDIIKINTDKNPKLVFKYRIMSIPTIIIFNNGKVTEELVGVHNTNEILELLDKIKEEN